MAEIRTLLIEFFVHLSTFSHIICHLRGFALLFCILVSLSILIFLRFFQKKGKILLFLPHYVFHFGILVFSAMRFSTRDH